MALRKPIPHDQHFDGRPKFEPEQVSLPRHSLLAAQAVLQELQQLLDEYGPTWYSEELSDKLALVLASLEEEV